MGSRPLLDYSNGTWTTLTDDPSLYADREEFEMIALQTNLRHRRAALEASSGHAAAGPSRSDSY